MGSGFREVGSIRPFHVDLLHWGVKPPNLKPQTLNFISLYTPLNRPSPQPWRLLTCRGSRHQRSWRADVPCPLRPPGSPWVTGLGFVERRVYGEVGVPRILRELLPVSWDRKGFVGCAQTIRLALNLSQLWSKFCLFSERDRGFNVDM